MGKLKINSTVRKQFYIWHWVSSAICLFAMLIFAFTGITLNHAGSIKASSKQIETTELLPAGLRKEIHWVEGDAYDFEAVLPTNTRRWLDRTFELKLKNRIAEWSQYEIYVALAKPGGDAWMTIDRETGEVFYSETNRGWIAYLNDLHKGRNTGKAWIWFLDIFSVAAIVFCLTGLMLLVVHAKRRPSTWPVVLAGILIPILILVFFVH